MTRSIFVVTRRKHANHSAAGAANLLSEFIHRSVKRAAILNVIVAVGVAAQPSLGQEATAKPLACVIDTHAHFMPDVIPQSSFKQNELDLMSKINPERLLDLKPMK